MCSRCVCSATLAARVHGPPDPDRVPDADARHDRRYGDHCPTWQGQTAIDVPKNRQGASGQDQISPPMQVYACQNINHKAFQHAKLFRANRSPAHELRSALPLSTLLRGRSPPIVRVLSCTLVQCNLGHSSRFVTRILTPKFVEQGPLTSGSLAFEHALTRCIGISRHIPPLSNGASCGGTRLVILGWSRAPRRHANKTQAGALRCMKRGAGSVSLRRLRRRCWGMCGVGALWFPARRISAEAKRRPRITFSPKVVCRFRRNCCPICIKLSTPPAQCFTNNLNLTRWVS